MPETDPSPLAAHGLADERAAFQQMLVDARWPDIEEGLSEWCLAEEAWKAGKAFALRSSQPDTREGFAAGIEEAAKVADSAAFDGYRNAAAANYRAPEDERLVRWTAQNIAASIRALAKETTDG